MPLNSDLSVVCAFAFAFVLVLQFSGTPTPSLVTDLLQRNEKEGKGERGEEAVKCATATIHMGAPLRLSRILLNCKSATVTKAVQQLQPIRCVHPPDFPSDLSNTKLIMTSIKTSSAIASAMLALLQHPDVQTHAQAEIDRVVGRNRLPDFSDRDDLPYVNAVCREVLRWKVVLPLGVTHAVLRDDVYEGYFIPKGMFYESLCFAQDVY